MEREIAAVLRWQSGALPGRPEGYFIEPYLAQYIDDLVRDMGCSTVRTWNPLT